MGRARPHVPDRRPVPDLTDPDGHARRAYGENTLFLVRPDGYITTAATTPDPVTTALTGYFPTADASRAAA